MVMIPSIPVQSSIKNRSSGRLISSGDPNRNFFEKTDQLAGGSYEPEKKYLEPLF